MDIRNLTSKPSVDLRELLTCGSDRTRGQRYKDIGMNVYSGRRRPEAPSEMPQHQVETGTIEEARKFQNAGLGRSESSVTLIKKIFYYLRRLCIGKRSLSLTIRFILLTKTLQINSWVTERSLSMPISHAAI
jgi:hypothetical protein